MNTVSNVSKTDARFVSLRRGEIDFLNCFIDLHLHFDGSMSLESARELAKIQNITLPEKDSELRSWLCVDKDCADLNEFLAKFELPLKLLQTKESLKLAAEILLRELKEDGLIYVEFRFAPQSHMQNGLTMEEAVQAVLAGMAHSEIKTNLILCCMRGENNQELNRETVRLAAKYLDKGVCAIDLAGAEAIFPTDTYGYIFDLANELGVPYTIHAGEADGPDSVKAAVLFGTKRIGHGIRSVESSEVMDLVKKEQVTLDLCPSSNLSTKMYETIKDYPIRTLLNHGIPVTINTDDMGVIGTDIKNEFRLLTETFDFSKDDIRGFLYNSVNASFASEEVKEELKRMIDEDMLNYHIPKNERSL